MVMDKDKNRELQGKDFVDAVEPEDGLQRRRRSSRKTIGEEGSRRQTAVVLAVTLILGMFFYFPTEFKLWWKSLNQEEVITIVKPIGDEADVSEVVGFKVEIKKEDDAEEVINKLLGELTGDYGVYVKRLITGEELAVNQGKVFSAASVIKLPILVAYYQTVEAGKLKSEDIYVLKEKDRLEYGTGSMQNQPVGTEYSYREVARLVANESDNMASQIMLSFLDRMVRGWGLRQTSVKEYETTPEEMGKLFELLYQGELLNQESRTELFENLTQTVNEDRITAGVPTGVRVVHKFGSEVGVVNDCGIVYPSKARAGGDYVICLLSTDVNDGEAQEVLPKISRVVWEWLES
jgi:beta-lactamase class A